MLALPAFVMGVVALAMLGGRSGRAARIAGLVAVVLGVGAAGVGALGRQSGLANVERALATPDIDDQLKARVRAQGTKEANECVEIGAEAGALPILLGASAIAMGLAAAKREGKAETSPPG
jgi:hypothetical protein